MTRFRQDEGAYAILYALLVVVLVGMASIIVDLGLLRADKRDARTASDVAALAGATDIGTGPYNPQKACLTAWTYAFQSLGQSVPGSNPCGSLPTSVSICPSSAGTVQQTSGEFTVAFTWPVPYTSTSLSNADGLAPGASPRPYASPYDGSQLGCDRYAVSIAHTRSLGLAAALGVTTAGSNGRSVARVTLTPKRPTTIAALNILDPTACESLTTGGQGKIIVNRATDLSPGAIAVESDGSGCAGKNNQWVVDAGSDANARICASGPSQVPDSLGTCDGFGRVEVFSMTTANAASTYAGYPNNPTQQLAPRPSEEQATFSWTPVTSVYGCATMPGCGATPTYIPDLFTHDNATWPPSSPYVGTGGYTGTDLGGFQTLSDGLPMGPGTTVPLGLGVFKCQQSNASPASSFYVPPGNWLVDCPDGNNSAGFQVAEKAIFGGGQLVFRGGISVANAGACFSVNTPLPTLPATTSQLTCPTVVNGSNEQATTSPAPAQEAIVFVRGVQGFTNGANTTTILLPETLVAQANNGLLNIGGGGGILLWTAPGAGALTAGKTTLDGLCPLDTTDTTTCHDSHFAKTAYWNETKTTGNSILSLKGQGGLSLVGTYFTPRANFVFSGQSAYYATNAQFWVNTLALSGKTGLGMTPDAGLSFKSPGSAVQLIR